VQGAAIAPAKNIRGANRAEKSQCAPISSRATAWGYRLSQTKKKTAFSFVPVALCEKALKPKDKNIKS
jgi:hypothetical protein